MPPLTPDELLAALRADGFTLAAGGTCGPLRVSPAGELSDADRHAIRCHKEGLLELLRREAAWAAAARKRAPHDPRPDLDAAQRDAVWWSVLLALAAEVHGDRAPRGVYGALHGARCMGAGLAQAPGGALRIVAGSVHAGELPAVRGAWLAPHRATVLELLRAVAGAWQAHAADLAEVAATIRGVRRVWPDARELSGPEVEAIDALPIADLRALSASSTPGTASAPGARPDVAASPPGGGRP